MALTPDQIDDLVSLTLNRFKRHKWTDISLDLQEYVHSTIMSKKSVTERGGPKISFRVQHKNTGNARLSGLFDTDSTMVDDVMLTGEVPWSKTTSSFAYDVDEDLFQSDRETIIKELKVREHDAMNSLAELNEEKLWSEPTNSSDTSPLGIPYWIQKSTTEGFNGGNPSAHSSSGAAGIDSDTYTNWRNYTFGYDTVGVNDMVKKVKKAIAYTKFMAPHPHPQLGYGNAEAYHIYTVYSVRDELERIAESRNDNLGSDVAKYINKVTIAGIPVDWVPYLDNNDTQNPVYGVNWKVFRPFVKKGCNGRRTGPFRSAKQHTVREVHIDTWYNYCCVNRRNTFVGRLN